MGCNQSSSAAKYTPSTDKHSSTPSNPTPSAHEFNNSIRQQSVRGPSKYAVSIPASWRLSKAESREALHAIFTEFNTDVQGHLSREELTVLLRAICNRENVDLGSPWTDKQVTNVMSAFDEDGNGTVEEEEFVHWILQGLGRTEKERIQFARRSPLAFKLDQFLTALANTSIKYHESHRPDNSRRKLPGNVNKKLLVGNTGLSKIEIIDCLHQAFEQYDEDGNQSLDVDELQVLVEDITTKGRVSNGSHYTKRDVAQIMKAFDSDGNGTVEENEFESWIFKGMEQSEKDRRAFKNSGDLALKLDVFLTAITHVCQDNHQLKDNVLLGDCGFNENEFRSALHAIFEEFSKTDAKMDVGDGAFNSTELKTMMNDVCSRLFDKKREGVRGSNHVLTPKFTKKEIKQVINIFDEDGNGLVEERELMNWIVEGVKRSDDDRVEFAKMSPLAAKLDVFLRGVLSIVKDWHDNHKEDQEISMKHRDTRLNRSHAMERTKSDQLHIDSWDETFQDMEHKLKAEAMTPTDFAIELNALSTNFQLKISEIEQRMNNMTNVQNLMSNSSNHNNNDFSTGFSPSKEATDRINFLESRVELLCTKLGIENDLENTVPYIPHAEDWKLKSPSPLKKQKMVHVQRKQSSPPQKSKSSNSQRSRHDIEEEDDHHDIVLMSSSDEEEEPEDDDHDYVIHLDSLEF